MVDFIMFTVVYAAAVWVMAGLLLLPWFAYHWVTS